jgi:mono/diheme cytochrome c family protein
MMMKWRSVKTVVWIVFPLLLAGVLGAQTQQSASSDDDKGKSLVQSKCTKCHGLEEVETAYLDKDSWKETIEFMRTKGADLKDDEVAIIVNYLVKTYSSASSSTSGSDDATKKLVEGTCGSCHGMDIVTSAQKTKDEWADVVRNMISYGATVKEDQVADVTAYLSKQYSPKK